MAHFIKFLHKRNAVHFSSKNIQIIQIQKTINFDLIHHSKTNNAVFKLTLMN